MDALLALLPAGGAPGGAIAAAGVGIVTAAVVAEKLGFIGARSRRHLNLPPAVPGLPLIGNLHQLKEKRPHQTFTKWSEIYGPIYSIKTGASSLVVLNTAEVAKEAMVAKFPSISTRKLSKALTTLTHDKAMVATSDYDDFHKTVKRYIMTSVLGTSGQKQFRGRRDKMIANMISTIHGLLNDDPHAPVNFREVFKNELFRISMIESLGEDVNSVYVEEFGKEISKEDMYNILVVDMMMGAIEVDWRDFFPYLWWIPNKSLEAKVRTAAARRTAVTRALIKQQKKRIARGEAATSYLDFLLAENTLTEEQLEMMVWEVIIESSDTTLVTTEWAMYELSKNPEIQDRLYGELREVCGSEPVTEEHLPRLVYLNAVFHETLRRHSPVPLVPPRYVHEDTQLQGYDIPAGTQIAINLYACNMNKRDWDEPEEWKPERFLDSSKFEPSEMHKTMAFGAGKRVCAGSLQAILISCVSIGRFVQEFEWRLEKDDEKVDTVQLTTHRLNPLSVFVTPRGGKMKKEMGASNN